MLLMRANVTEMKWNIFGQLWILKIFFSNVYISVNTLFECCYLFFRWEIGHPLTTYATGGMEGRSSKVCAGAYRAKGVEKSVIRFVRAKWIAPKIILWNIFCCTGLTKYTRASSSPRNMLFCSTIITIIYPMR